MNYSFNINTTGGADARAQLPDRITGALSAVQSDPTAGEGEADAVKAIGQHLDYALSQIGEDCMVDVTVSKSVMQQSGETSTSVVIRERPFNRPVQKAARWTPDQGPLTVRPAASSPATTTPAATPAAQ